MNTGLFMNEVLIEYIYIGNSPARHVTPFHGSLFLSLHGDVVLGIKIDQIISNRENAL